MQTVTLTRLINLHSRILLTIFVSVSFIPKDEIKRYLCESTITYDGVESVTKYWKEREKDFPLLAQMARDYLSLMPGSVSSERSFSLSNLTISKTRTSLNPQTAKELVCAMSWSKLKLTD